MARTRPNAHWRSLDEGPDHDYPGYPDISCADGHDPESATAFTAAQTRDNADANAWLISSEANWVDAGRPYPWAVQYSGFCALTAYVLASGTPYVPRRQLPELDLTEPLPERLDGVPAELPGTVGPTAQPVRQPVVSASPTV